MVKTVAKALARPMVSRVKRKTIGPLREGSSQNKLLRSTQKGTAYGGAAVGAEVAVIVDPSIDRIGQ